MSGREIRHLTEDELDEVLMDVAAVGVKAHASGCSLCRDRLSAFEAQINVFNHASLAWSAARSNTISRNLPTHKPAFRLTPKTIWSLAGAAGMALLFGAMVTVQRGSLPVASDGNKASIVIHQPHSAIELERDNEMMAAIDSEMNSPQADRLGLDETTRVSGESLRRSTRREVKD
jgi:hypothetical protein